MDGQMGGPPVIGIDLGGTKTLVAVVSGLNEILGRAKRPTPAEDGAAAILKAIVEGVDEALGSARLRREDIEAVGVGSPGPLNSETGVIYFSSNLKVNNFALGP